MAGDEDEPNLTQSVADAVDGPMEVAVAGMGMSREQRLDHKILAAKFLPSKAVARRNGAGIRRQRGYNGGAV